MNILLQMIKGLGSNHKSGLIIKLSLIFVLVTAIMSVMIFTSYSNDVNKGLATNLIRLHVIANSDTAEDQALKRSVRDRILNYMRVQLKETRDIEQTKFIINGNLSKIEEIARNEMAKQGKNYSVKAMLGSYPFPTKAYGDITLPAGNYQALRVVIGGGQGANWWCVLFPPLCFVDATHGTVPDSVKQELKNALSEEEYKIIASADSDDDIPVKVKFKIVEFFQDSKIKFSGLLSSIFK